MRHLVLIDGVLHEVDEPMTLVNFLATNGDPVVVVKEKVELLEDTSTISSPRTRIRLDSGNNIVVQGNPATTKAALEAA